MQFSKHIFWVIPFLIFSMTSCSKPDTDSDKKPKPEPTVEDSRYEQVHASQVIKGIDEFLGKGYKGYQFYANPESCTLPLFDLSDHSVVDIQKAPSYKGRFVSGETKTEFYDKFSLGVAASGTYDGFSGEITSNFSTEALRNRNNTFITSHITQTYYRLTLLEKATLLESVENDLATLLPNDLFAKYGTHYLKSIYIGGRISFSSYINRESISNNFDAKATVSAAYLQLVKGSASADTVNKSDLQQVVSNKEIDVMGGDPAKINHVIDGSGDPSQTYNAWSESVPDYMSISDFADGGLVPIYELVKDPVRQTTLKTAWEKYMADNTAAVLKEKEPASIKKNANFHLKSEDGRYVGKAPYKVTNAYYYPTMSSKKQKLQFASGKDLLETGHLVTIKTTESFEDTLVANWSKRVYLGAFVLKTWLYYWTQDGAKTNWYIEKVVPSSDKHVHYGDKIYIRNQHFSDQYLAPSKDGYLTTIKTPHAWVIQA